MIPEDNLVSGHVRNHVDPDKFNQEAMLPYSLRLLDFEIAIQDVYEVDTETEPARDRRPMSFTEVYLAHVGVDDFRSNPRGLLGTRTATLHREGVRKLREHWVYKT